LRSITDNAHFQKPANQSEKSIYLTGIQFDRQNQIKYMKRFYLGELEELLLLTIASLQDPAYGVNILKELEVQTGRAIDFSTIHTTLKRLEEKGFLLSEMGGATAERGGRRKRFFTITALGVQALRENHEMRNKLWSLVPTNIQMKGI
jgi:PadR family transcriptional regulator, regulatory protein PadR